jgi:hypothetical protein
MLYRQPLQRGKSTAEEGPLHRGKKLAVMGKAAAATGTATAEKEIVMPTYRHDDWSQLISAFVEVRKDWQHLRYGYVDDAMADSSALWLAAYGMDGRVLISKAEGYEVWVEPRQLEGVLAYRMTSTALQGPRQQHGLPQTRGMRGGVGNGLIPCSSDVGHAAAQP